MRACVRVCLSLCAAVTFGMSSGCTATHRCLVFEEILARILIDNRLCNLLQKRRRRRRRKNTKTKEYVV